MLTMQNVYEITAFGADPAGRENTAPIQAAIDACHRAGGGVVSVPAGVFTTGTLELKSNCTLYLGNGSVLKGAESMDAYPDTGLFHNEMGSVKSLLFAHDAENIQIAGSGAIDFSGDSFMDFSRMRSGGNERPQDLTPEEREETVCETGDRPNQMVFFERCRRIGIRGVKFTNAACWTLSFSNSRDIMISGIAIRNHRRVPNNDGIHITASSDVIVSDCSLSCGDDCIAISCITNDEGVSENIAVQNCNLQSSSAALRIGFQTGTVRRVVANNLNISDSNRGILIFSGRGSRVQGIALTNIVMQTAIKLGAWWGNGEPFVICADRGGYIGDVLLSHFAADCENSGVITGLDGVVENVRLRDGFIHLRDTEKRRKRGYVHRLSPAADIESSRDTMAPVCVYGGEKITLGDVDADVRFYGKE